MSILIWTLTECFPVHFKYFCKFSIKIITIWHFYSNFSTPAVFFEEMEPMFVIHNISIATDDDVIQFGDDVNIYPVYLSRAIIICGNCLNWLEKTIVSDHIFCQFLVSWLGNSTMATECTISPDLETHPLVLKAQRNRLGWWYARFKISTLISCRPWLFSVVYRVDTSSFC